MIIVLLARSMHREQLQQFNWGFTMKILQLVSKALVAGAFLASGAAGATTLLLPSANEMSVGVYNSFDVYSLDLLAKCAADPRCQPQSGLPVQSSPGNISDQALVLQSANGQDNFPPFVAGDKIDDPFLSPTGGQSVTFDMNSPMTPDVNNFVGDSANRWEMNLDLLRTYLDGHDLVFLFDNNQENNSTDFIFIWGQARIVDASGNTINNLCFEISTQSGGCDDTGPNPTPNMNPVTGDYLPAVSDFCVDKLTGASYNIGGANNAGDCPVDVPGGHPSGGYQINNNVSTSKGEFAAFNRALHDAATDTANGQYFLQLNIKYFSNNAGAEQLWICSDCDVDVQRQVPEPASLPMVLLVLMVGGISLLRSRRK
jgi:hypothetical protein